MQNRRLFFTDEDDSTGRNIVIEEDVYAIWAYLTFPNELDIDKSCFLTNSQRVTNIEAAFEICKEKKLPPPITKEFASGLGRIEKLDTNDITVNWFQDGNAVLKIKGNPVLFFSTENNKGYCKSIGKNGNFGNAWDESKYEKIIAHK